MRLIFSLIYANAEGLAEIHSKYWGKESLLTFLRHSNPLKQKPGNLADLRKCCLETLFLHYFEYFSSNVISSRWSFISLGKSINCSSLKKWYDAGIFFKCQYPPLFNPVITYEQVFSYILWSSTNVSTLWQVLISSRKGLLGQSLFAGEYCDASILPVKSIFWTIPKVWSLSSFNLEPSISAAVGFFLLSLRESHHNSMGSHLISSCHWRLTSAISHQHCRWHYGENF